MIGCRGNRTFLLLFAVFSGRGFPPHLAAVVHVVPQRKEHAAVGSERNQRTCWTNQITDSHTRLMVLQVSNRGNHLLVLIQTRAESPSPTSPPLHPPHHQDLRL